MGTEAGDAVSGPSIEDELVVAVEEQQFFVVYQPVFSLEDLGLLGFEALIRWRHPERGELPPSEFIPSLESSGLIRPAGLFVLAEACREAAAWQRVRPVSISVNISARQLDDDSLIEDVRSALAESSLEPAQLILELTESTLMRDPLATVEHLSMLRELGVRLAVDDFGTGYSSLSRLQRFPIDVLKIDRSFVSQLGESGGDALVHTFVQLGHNLGMETVAEGIETGRQLALLRREGCGAGQGFLMGRPLAAAATFPVLREGCYRPRAGDRTLRSIAS